MTLLRVMWTVGVITLCGCARSVPASSWALIHASVVDVERGRIQPDQMISIVDDRIVSVSAMDRATLPAGVRGVDVSGAFVVPGLFDMHAHSFLCAGEPCSGEPKLKRYVDAGVLGIRDMGAPLSGIVKASKDHSGNAPAIWFTGPILDGPRGRTDAMRITVTNEADARRAVGSLADAGVQFIKVHDWLSPPAYLAIAAAARERHLPVVGHVPAGVSIDDVFTAGQGSVEHLGGLTHAILRACGHVDPALTAEMLKRGATTDKLPVYQFSMSASYLTPLLDAFDLSACTAVTRRLAGANVAQVPTLGLWRSWAQDESGSPADRSARQRLFDAVRRVVLLMHQSGVQILTGNDEELTSSIQSEMELLVDAGLSPAVALRSATIDPARFLGVTASYGSIATGQYANVLVVGGNPLNDIRNASKIQMIVLQGRQVARPGK